MTTISFTTTRHANGQWLAVSAQNTDAVPGCNPMLRPAMDWRRKLTRQAGAPNRIPNGDRQSGAHGSMSAHRQAAAVQYGPSRRDRGGAVLTDEACEASTIRCGPEAGTAADHIRLHCSFIEAD